MWRITFGDAMLEVIRDRPRLEVHDDGLVEVVREGWA
jgi:hypothetical protein